jgi:hypothetical protein
MLTMCAWLPQKSFNHQLLKEDNMTRSEKQKYTQQFETIIYQLANLMIDTVKVTLHTLDDYHQLLDENSNQNRGDDIPF